MATVKTLVSGNRKLVITINHAWVTANEADVVVVDRSTLTGPDGSSIPGRIRVDEITWAVSSGLESVTLEFDDATDEVIGNYQGQGYMDYRPYGGLSMAGDPTSDTEGDILLSETGGAAGEFYNITLHCTLKN
jgi:hypothetical protein